MDMGFICGLCRIYCSHTGLKKSPVLRGRLFFGLLLALILLMVSCDKPARDYLPFDTSTRYEKEGDRLATAKR